MTKELWVCDKAAEELDTYLIGSDGIFWCRVVGSPGRDAARDARIITEAGNVANETGRTPRQLADERAELLEACEQTLTYLGSVDTDKWPPALDNMLRKAVSKVKGGAA